MKPLLSRKIRQVGSVLLATFVICAIFSVFVVYYLSLAEQQAYLNARAQAWNMAIAITEAGIEEALQHLNSNVSNLARDGWTADGTGYSRSNTLAGGNSYTMYLSVTNTEQPIIIAKAYVVPPTLVKNAASPNYFASVIGGSAQATVLARAVQVTCGRANMYSAALVVKKDIDMNGNGVLTDSYNSQDPLKSTNGKYDSGKYTGNRGDIATNGSLTNSTSVSIGNANVYGHVHLGPNCSISYGPNGGVGPHGGQGQPAPGWVVNDANFTFPDTSLPSTAGWPAPPSGIVITNRYVITTNVVVSTNFPSSWPLGGVQTNVLTTTTVATIPSPMPPGLTTNATLATVSTYPNPVPAGMFTNTVMVYNSATIPSPPPAGSSTNPVRITSTTFLSPMPAGTTTNTTPNAYSYALPAPGVAGGYLPGTQWYNNGAGWKNDYWYYTRIDSFNYITGYTYNYPTLTYSYYTYTYTYPTYQYTYNTYQTNTYQVTNFYNHVLFANTSYVTNSLAGSTIVLGQNATLVQPAGLSGGENITFPLPGPVWYALGSGTSFGATNLLSISQTPTLLIKAGGTSVGIAGNNIVNPSGAAASFIVWCAPTVTSFSLSGNGTFTGVLVAPNADLALNGGGSSEEDFCGSIMAKSARLNGHFNFHWDEALGSSGATGRYLATTWNEIAP